MDKEKELLAYCGLYCADCAGYSGEIAASAINLKEQLTKYKFDRTRQVLFPYKLKDYDKFCDMLEFIMTLKCEKICRDKKDNETECKIRRCCKDKGFFACYECEGFEECETLKNQTNLHGDALLKNFHAIKNMGLEKWVREGKRYWFADD